MLRDDEFAASVDSSVAIKMGNASRNGDQDRKDLQLFVISQCSFLGCVYYCVFSADCSSPVITRCVTAGVVRR